MGVLSVRRGGQGSSAILKLPQDASASFAGKSSRSYRACELKLSNGCLYQAKVNCGFYMASRHIIGRKSLPSYYIPTSFPIKSSEHSTTLIRGQSTNAVRHVRAETSNKKRRSAQALSDAAVLGAKKYLLYIWWMLVHTRRFSKRVCHLPECFYTVIRPFLYNLHGPNSINPQPVPFTTWLVTVFCHV